MSKFRKWAVIRNGNASEKNLPKISLKKKIQELREEGYYIINEFKVEE